jgi:hypothetical protein
VGSVAKRVVQHLDLVKAEAKVFVVEQVVHLLLQVTAMFMCFAAALSINILQMG